MGKVTILSSSKCYERVIVAGAGALGSAVLSALGRSRCPAVFVVDPDVVERGNLAHSDLLDGEATIGKSKVACVLESLRERFPFTDWSGIESEIADVDTAVFREADLLFGCVDTDLGRVEMAAIGARFQLPICDGGLGGTATNLGRVSWLPGGRAACFSCLLGTGRRARLLMYGEAMVHGCSANEMFPHEGWVANWLTAQSVGRLQVDTALSAVSAGAGAYTLAIDSSSSEGPATIWHEVSAVCPFHDDEICRQVSFPIAEEVQCCECGYLSYSGRRIAWVRRWAACPECTSKKLSIRSTKREADMAGWEEQGAATA